MSASTPPVVVGINGSDNSFRAAQWAAALAGELETALHLVHSSTSTGRFVSTSDATEAAADRHATAEKIVATARDAVHAEFAGLDVGTDVVAEPAARALTQLSRHAEFIVVASDDVTRMAALLLGSTSLAVATHARCPVVAWRTVPRPDSAPIVVGVDGTAAGAAALSTAFQFADLFGAPVRLVHAWSTGVAGDQSAFPFLVDWAAVEAAEWALLNEAARPWMQRYPEVEVETYVEIGKPGRVLLDHCTDAQLVGVGDHSTTTLASALLGSTSLNLLHHSSIPVMICHALEEEG